MTAIAVGCGTIPPMIEPLRVAGATFTERLGALEGAHDPLERAKMASELWSFVFHELQPALTAERRAAVRRLRQDMTTAEIGAHLGVTDSRVSAICRGPS